MNHHLKIVYPSRVSILINKYITLK